MTTNTDINELAQQLREAAEKASRGIWRGSMTRFNGIINNEITAVLFNCESEAIIASTVEKRDAEFIALANPVNIRFILDALEAAQQQNAELSDKLAREQDYCLGVDTERMELHKRIKELEASQPVVPESYCLMPLTLTAENGAKNALTGEFHTIEHIGCVVCGGDGIDGDDECDNCDGSGDVVVQAPVSWTTIKDIYKAAVKCCAIQSFGNSKQLKEPEAE